MLLTQMKKKWVLWYVVIFYYIVVCCILLNFCLKAKILQRNSKSFDTRRTTYLAMKIAIHNRFAETLNMEGRRGEKLAFGKYKVCTTIIGNLNVYNCL